MAHIQDFCRVLLGRCGSREYLTSLTRELVNPNPSPKSYDEYDLDPKP